MRFPKFIFTILTILSPILTSTHAQLDDNIICPDGSLTNYLTSLLDVLFNNGLTTFEQLIVHWSQTDLGYEFLHDLYTSGQKLTILIPTNEAFQQSGIVSPFNGLTDDWGTELGELHVLQGEWTYDKIPDPSQGIHAVASTSLLLANEFNQTDSKSNANQAMVLERGHDNQIIVNGWWMNATSWSGPLDTSSAGGLLGNLVLLPIDQVLSFPPSLSTALQAPGLTNMSSAFSVVGRSQEVEQLTEGGFTIFVPIDSVWSDDIKSIMLDQDKAPELVGNHYTTSYSLFSPGWIQSTTMDLNAESGETLTLQLNQDGSSSVIFGDVEAKIIRSDITLNNGVMHIIDQILYPTSTGSTKNATATTSSPSTAKSTSTSSSKPGTNDKDGSKQGGDNGKDGDKDENGKAVIPDAASPTSSASAKTNTALSVYLMMAATIIGFIFHFQLL